MATTHGELRQNANKDGTSGSTGLGSREEPKEPGNSTRSEAAGSLQVVNNRDYTVVTIHDTPQPLDAFSPLRGVSSNSRADELRTARTDLNVTTHSIPPTTGTMMRGTSGGEEERKTTSGAEKKKTSRYAQVKCNKCSKLGHIKKHCKSGAKPANGGTRQKQKETLIKEDLQREEEHRAGAEDAKREAKIDPVHESAPHSSKKPEDNRDDHYSSLATSLTNVAEETKQLEAVLSRCSSINPESLSPISAFLFWLWKVLALVLFGTFLQILVLGWWTLICVIAQSPLFGYTIYSLWRDCKEKGNFYEFYLRSMQLDSNYVKVECPVVATDYDTLVYKTNLRVDTHSLKDAELKPYLHQVSIWRPNSRHWILNLVAPAFFRKAPEMMVISATLLKQQICDIDVFYDADQLVLKSQMQALRNQRVYISSHDVAQYGDIHGNTAFIAALHNERINSKKRGLLDFLRSPARA